MREEAGEMNEKSPSQLIDEQALAGLVRGAVALNES